MTVEQARRILLNQEGVEEREHHGHPDFRVKNKIFSTMWPTQARSVLRLPMEVAEKIAEENQDRSKLVSRSGGAGWLSVDLKNWKVNEFRPLAQLARSLRNGENQCIESKVNCRIRIQRRP